MAALGQGLALPFIVLKGETGEGGAMISPLALKQRNATLIVDRAGANILTRV